MIVPRLAAKLPALLAICLLASAAAQAQGNADDAHVHYTVKAGDNMSTLAQRHLQDEGDLAEVARVNQIPNIHRVQVGRVIKIPRQILKYTPAQATVTQINCTTALRLDGEQSQDLKPGSILREGDVLRIPAGCRLSMSFEDQATVRLLSGAVVQLKTLRRNAFDAAPQVHLELLNGRLSAKVPTRAQPNAPFQVTTPSSMAGIRGTQFRAGFEADQGNAQVEVLNGAVAAQGLADTQIARLETQHGMAIASHGKAFEVERLLPAPRFEQLAIAASGNAPAALHFAPPAQARRFSLTTSQDANFRAILSTQFTEQARIDAPNLSAKADFYQWAAISGTGVMGLESQFAICQGYQTANAWRCNVPFNFVGLTEPRLRLEKIDNTGALVVMDGPIRATEDSLLVFKGLPTGQYRWRIDFQVTPGQSGHEEGQFELIALPTPNA
jgi:hypothetical protein